MGPTSGSKGENAVWGDVARRMAFALWAVPGVGPRGLRVLLADRPPSQFADVPWEGLPTVDGWRPVRAHLAARGLRSLDALAECTLEASVAAGMSVCLQGDPAYPAELAACETAPPVLFFHGRGGSARRRVALVGTRRTTARSALQASSLAATLCEAGVTVVSGAAVGIDQACHEGALRAGGETWAFLGSALDQIDAGQLAITRKIIASEGTVYTEFPPGVRANRTTFPRRNRLISGCSEAVVVLRAQRESGALHTAEYALKQGKRLFVLAGDPGDPSTEGGLEYAEDGRAELIVSAEHLLRLLGFGVVRSAERPAATPDLSELSEEARRAFEALSRHPLGFDELLGKSGVDAGALVSALSELELSGLAVQRPGRFYERI